MADFPQHSRATSSVLAEEKGLVVKEPKKDRPYLGSSVKDGFVRYSSVSQIVIASPDQEGGCLRRWAGIYLFGRKEEKSAAQLAGNQFASSQEHYLKTGEDVLDRELRPLKHFLPKPGPDLEVERDLGPDPAAAILLRERLHSGGPLDPVNFDPHLAQEQVERLAGLTVCGVPLIGAFDFRHHRNEYVDSEGVLRKEAPGYVVGETGDLKTTSRINDHTTRGGTFLEGRAKTPEAVSWQPQMIGYGVADANEHPENTHERLSHLYAQTKNGFVGAKRTILLTVDEVRERWRTKVEPRMREMIDIAATITDMNQAPSNFFSCTQFGQKPCSQVPFCDRTGYTILDLFRRREGDIMGNGLFDELASPAAAASPAEGLGLFSPESDTLEIPDLPESERAPIVQAEVARLQAEDKATPNGAAVHRPPPREIPGDPLLASVCEAGTHYFVPCEEGRPPIKMKFSDEHKGVYKFVDALGGMAKLEGKETVFRIAVAGGCGAKGCGLGCAPGWVLLENGAHGACSACSGTGRPIGAVNPPDATAGGPLEDARALPPEAIAEITDPALREKAEAHARAHAEKAAKEAAEKPQKAGGRCPGGGQLVAITQNAKGKQRLLCGICGEERRVPKDVVPGTTSAPMPGHNLPKEEVTNGNGVPDRQLDLYGDDLPDVPVEAGLPAHLARAAIEDAPEIEEEEVTGSVLDVVASLQRAISVLGTLDALGEGDEMASALRERALGLVGEAARGLRG